MAETKKASYLVSNSYTLVGDSSLAPGDRVLLDESDSHKYLKAQVESGNPDYAHLSVVEVDHEQEAKRAEEEKEMAEKAQKIAAEAQAEQVRAVQEQLDKQAEAEEERQESGAPSAIEGTNFPPQDVESQRLAEQAGPGQRASTQEDVVEESSGKSGRRSSRSKS